MINVSRPEVIPFPYGLSVAFFRGGPTKWDDPGPAGVAASNNLNRVTIHHNPPSQKGHYKLYNPKVLGNCSSEKVCQLEIPKCAGGFFFISNFLSSEYHPGAMEGWCIYPPWKGLRSLFSIEPSEKLFQWRVVHVNTEGISLSPPSGISTTNLNWCSRRISEPLTVPVQLCNWENPSTSPSPSTHPIGCACVSMDRKLPRFPRMEDPCHPKSTASLGVSSWWNLQAIALLDHFYILEVVAMIAEWHVWAKEYVYMHMKTINIYEHIYPVMIYYD